MGEIRSTCVRGVIADCQLPIANWNTGNPQSSRLFNRQLAIGNRRSARAYRNYEFSPGWVFMEVLVATMLVGILAIILSKAVGAHQNGTSHLAEMRAASRLAESAMLSMQAGQSWASVDENQSITIHPVSQGTDISGMSWVEIDATVHGRSAGLVGLVPSGSIPGGGK